MILNLVKIGLIFVAIIFAAVGGTRIPIRPKESGLITFILIISLFLAFVAVFI